MTKILFVCLGNICRSPLAEALFVAKLKKNGLEKKIMADSAGTGNYHVGDLPDSRTLEVARKNSVPMNHIARQLKKDDFHEFDYIVTMDGQNFADAKFLKPEGSKAELLMMREFDDANEMDVPDPYFGGKEGFDNVFSILDDATDALLAYLQEKHKS